MKWTHHLFSAVQFFQVLLLVIGGIFCIALPFAPPLRVIIANAFLFKEDFFFALGIILLIVGVILGIGFYFLQRQVVLQVSMNPPATVEKEVVASLLKLYMQKRFPDQTFKTEAMIDSEGVLELISDMPSIPSPEVEKHLAEIEMEIGELLKRTLHYQKRFAITFMK